MRAEVSIIVPVYGVEKYVGHCAESIFSQTTDLLEIIFVDDCSPDRSVEVIEEVLKRFPKRKEQVRIVRLEKNGGVDNARREGCFTSSGQYVLFVDGDDYIEPQMVEILLARAKESGADMTVCRFNKVEEDGTCVPDVHEDNVDDPDRYLGDMISLSSCHASPNIFNRLLRTDLLKKVRYLPQGNIAEDWMLCVQMTHKAEKLVAVNDILYNYVQRSGSITHTVNPEVCRAAARADMANINIILHYLDEEGLTERYRDEIDARKYNAKGCLNAYCEDRRMYKEWKAIYREVNAKVLFNPCLSSYEKKSFVLRFFRMRTTYYRIVGKTRKLLNIVRHGL